MRRIRSARRNTDRQWKITKATNWERILVRDFLTHLILGSGFFTNRRSRCVPPCIIWLCQSLRQKKSFELSNHYLLFSLLYRPHSVSTAVAFISCCVSRRFDFTSFHCFIPTLFTSVVTFPLVSFLYFHSTFFLAIFSCGKILNREFFRAFLLRLLIDFVVRLFQLTPHTLIKVWRLWETW